MFKKSAITASIVASALLCGGCKEEPKVSQGSRQQPAATKPAGDEHPNAIGIGEHKHEGLTIKASQDEAIKAGGESAFDVAISGYAEGQAPKSIRFWVGTEKGEGSVKSLAEVERPGVWHAHVEVPEKLPEGSKFWIAVEPATGDTFNVSFDLAK